MSRRSLSVLVVLVALTAFGIAQGRYRSAAHAGPYRAFVSKPIVIPGIKAGDLYSEQEYLGAMLNELAAQGLRPVLTELASQTLGTELTEHRLVVVCLPE